MLVAAPDTARFVTELDAAVQAHMDWTRRIIRFAVLRTPPDADVIDPLAHTLCRFGAWFCANRAHFDALDPAAAQAVERVHQRMHDAIRAIFSCLDQGTSGSEEELDAFETTQAELIELLTRFKTLFLSQAAARDPLTGLPLRHDIETDFARHQKDAARNGSLLYLVMIDIDHFKRVNDSYGHPTGDLVLRQISTTLQQALRGNEPLYRYGGEEFLWLLKCRSVEEAKKSARRALATVGTTPVRIEGGDILRLTITLGLARSSTDEPFDSVFARADRALYEGKRRGRNCFVFAND